MVASNYGHTEVVEELINAGADLDMTTVRSIKYSYTCRGCNTPQAG